MFSLLNPFCFQHNLSVFSIHDLSLSNMGELILLLGDEFHHLRQKQKGKKVGESKY